jgi:YD repeat-containing protein
MILLVFCTVHPVFAQQALPDGSLSYSVPIVLPPGTAGCAPSLSLDYNSSGRNGIVGVGWQISGLGAIVRDTSKDLNYNGTDGYIGPNGKLVSIPGDATMFHSKDESFSQFRMVGGRCGVPSEPEYWVEYCPDGTVKYYGLTADSKGLASERGGYIYSWALCKVVDIHGNYYTVEYSRDAEQLYPVKIVYTQNEGISSYRVVEFEYEGRLDYNTDYTYRTRVARALRLKYVRVKTDVISIFGYNLAGTTARTYTINYESPAASYSRSLVSSITDGLNTHIFSYSSNSPSWGQEYVFPRCIEAIYAVTDTDWDGYPEIMFSTEYNYGVTRSHCSGSSLINFYHYSSSDQSFVFNKETSLFTTFDINGDGLEDRITRSGEGTGTLCQVYKGYGDVWEDVWWSEWPCRDERYTLGDINGDGYGDFIALSGSQHGNWAYLSNGHSFEQIFSTGWPSRDEGINGIVDVNSDGVPDKIVNSGYYEDQTRVYISPGPVPGLLVNAKVYKYGLELTNTSITYTPAAHHTGAICGIADANGYASNNTVRQLVTSISTSAAGTNYIERMTYTYYNGKRYWASNTPGAEYYDLGFEYIISSNSASGETVKTWYAQNDYRYHGKAIRRETSLNGNLVKTEVYEYNQNPVTSWNTYYVQAKKITTSTIDAGVAFSHVMELDYDEYNNVTKQTEKLTGQDELITEIAYSVDLARWLINRVVSVKKTSKGELLSHSAFIWSANDLVEMQRFDDSGNGWISTKYEYDNYGNVIAIINPKGGVSRFTFDSDYHSFPETMTNAMGHVSQFDIHLSGESLRPL